MKTDKNIKHEGELDLNGLKIKCYVLADETRVLSSREMQRVLKFVDEDSNYQVSGDRLNRQLNQKSMMPFLYQGKETNHYEPIECFNGDSKVHGFEATKLVDICDAFMEAKNNIELSSRQKIIAAQCEILIRSFAKIGIIALVDEATGYKKQRENEYRKLIATYIADELKPWVKTFDQSFFEHIYRLNGWDWGLITRGERKNHPQVVGKMINDLVYNRLPEGVLEELQTRNPKNAKGNRVQKHHQFLSTNVGERELLKHLGKLEVVFSMFERGEYEKAKAYIEDKFPKLTPNAQQRLALK